MSELPQQECKWTVAGKEPPTINLIRERLIKRGFPVNHLRPDILINIFMHKKEKHTLVIGKVRGILSKPNSDAL